MIRRTPAGFTMRLFVSPSWLCLRELEKTGTIV